MVEKGLWGEGAYVDAGGDMLFRSQEDAEAYRIDRRAAEEPAEPTQAEEGYSGVLRSIRRANDRIADPVLSQKIDRLEEIAGRIFPHHRGRALQARTGVHVPELLPPHHAEAARLVRRL